jgi:enoyl-CoA hydratase/carnithine racemase
VLQRIEHDNILELRLDRPPANALDPELVGRLLAEVNGAALGAAEALLLSGAPGMFSAGLDVPRLLELDRQGIRSVWADYLALVRAIALSPVPVAAAITGHSPAGGAVLALFCDQRVMAEGAYTIGLNEVRVGLPVPSVIVAATARLVGVHQAERLCVRGLMLSGVEARAIGLVDRLAPVDEVIERALLWCRELTGLPRQAMAETRRIARAGLHRLFEDPAEPVIDHLVERWFGAEAQSALRALVEKLRAPRSR